MTDRRKTLRTIVLHTVLILGCFVFALPFYWLVTTSMKDSTEIFVSPPKWVPGLPAKVVQSPYASADVHDRLKMPDDRPLPLPEAEMAAVLNGLLAAAEATDPAGAAELTSLAGGGDLLARGLFNETAAGLPEDQWDGTADEIAERLSARVTADLCTKTFGNVFRGLSLGKLTTEDMLHRAYAAGDEQTVEAVSPNATTRPLGGSDATLVTYDVSSEREAVVRITAPMPEMEDALAGVRIPITCDRSWHNLMLEVATPEGRYVSTEGYALANSLSVEASWRLPESESGFRKEKDYTNLAKTDGPGTADGTIQVTLRLQRRAPIAAAFQKFTRAYSEALRYIDFWRYLKNTVSIVLLSIFGTLFSCSLVAYGFARLSFPGRDVLFGILLATMMLPAQVTMVPQFLVFRGLGLYNTLAPLWMPSFLGSAFFIFMLRQFMKTIPKDIEDAAKIDGCGYFGIYWRIMLPLIKPALAAVAIFTFMGAWNNFMGPLIYLNDERLYPLSLGIYQFRMEHGSEYSMMMAASTLMMLPVLTVFFFAQRYFIQGVTLTGVKG